jgi:PEP-CTERM motif
MKKQALLGAALGLALSFGAASMANATIFTFTQSGCSTSCGTGPFGAVTVTNDATDLGSLDVLVQLFSGVQFNGAGNSATHNSLAFDLVGSPTVTYKNLGVQPFADSGAMSNEAPFGAFGYSLDYTGPNHNPTGVTTLSFEIFSATASALHPLVLGSTDYNGTPLYFGADIASNGQTGNVGAVMGTGGVPEPASWALMLVGFGGLGAALRLRRRQTLAHAQTQSA